MLPGLFSCYFFFCFLNMTVTDFGRPSNLLADILIWRSCDSGGSSNQRVGVWSSSSGCMSSGNFLISAASGCMSGWALKMGHWRRWRGGRHMAWQPTSVISVWMCELMGELGKCCKAHWEADEVFGWWGESKWTDGLSTTRISPSSSLEKRTNDHLFFSLWFFLFSHWYNFVLAFIIEKFIGAIYVAVTHFNALWHDLWCF